jgi:hypothetical protein
MGVYNFGLTICVGVRADVAICVGVMAGLAICGGVSAGVAICVGVRFCFCLFVLFIAA